MGQENSKQLFVHLLRDILKVRGTKEKQQQLLQFLKCVKDVRPWFTEEGSTNLEI